MSAFKPVSRFLPTLTEVVQLPEVRVAPGVDRSEAIHHALQKLVPVLEEELRSAMTEVIEQQLRSLIPAMQNRIELAVRQAIVTAIEMDDAL